VRTPWRTWGLALAGLAALLAGLIVLTTLGVASAPDETRREPTHMRLVFLATPGPGGGGGGGGLRQPAPPPRAETKGRSVLRSPVPPPRRITTRPPDPEPKKTPPVTLEPVARATRFVLPRQACGNDAGGRQRRKRDDNSASSRPTDRRRCANHNADKEQRVGESGEKAGDVDREGV